MAADLLIEGLQGAMKTLVVGDPADPRTDIGPVIDEEAKAALDAAEETAVYFQCFIFANTECYFYSGFHKHFYAAAIHALIRVKACHNYLGRFGFYDAFGTGRGFAKV